MIIAPKIKPNIIDSNIDKIESGIDVWATDTTYEEQKLIQVDGGERIYQAVKDVPENINPLDDVNKFTGYGEYWFDVGATNYYRAFDEKGSSTTENETEIYYKFAISDVDTLMLENLQAEEVQIKVTDNKTGDVIQDVTLNTTYKEVSDWWEWTYAEPEYQRTAGAILFMSFDATLEVWIRNSLDVAKVAHIVYGRSRYVGLELANPAPVVSNRGITTKSRDQWGNIITRKKARYKRMSITCQIKGSTIDQIQQRLEKVVDIPLIVVGDTRQDGFKSLAIFGEIKDHDMPIGNNYTQYQLEVEGYI